ncbi:MAG: HEAT repeat domain-containing protein [Endomicrobia bacterium]|nr:HEAT repeat domain-containing protein [Endomicrobiia bacterium]
MFRNFLLSTILFFSIVFCFCEVTREMAEEKIAEILNSEQDSTIRIYILDNFSYYPSYKFLSHLNKIGQKEDIVGLKSLYVLYKVYKSTSALERISKILLTKPNYQQKESPVLKAKIYAKNQLRAEAAKILGELGDASHIDVLSKTVKDEDGVVSDASYFALALLSVRGKIKPLDDLKEFFYSGLKDTNPKVRVKAVEYLGALKYQDSVIPLSLRLKDNYKEVVLATVKSLGEIGDHSVLQDLLQLKNSQEASIRFVLAEALGNICGSIINKSTKTTETILAINKIQKNLSDLLNDTNGMVKVAAAVSLLKINNKSGLEIIKRGLESTDTDVVLYCINSLGAYGSLEDIKLIENFTTHSNVLVKTYAYVNILKIYYRNGAR